jgi:hypothetical protein
MNIMLVGCEARVTTTRPDKDAPSEARKDRRDSGGAGRGGEREKEGERTAGSNPLKKASKRTPGYKSSEKQGNNKTAGSGHGRNSDEKNRRFRLFGRKKIGIKEPLVLSCFEPLHPRGRRFS